MTPGKLTWRLLLGVGVLGYLVGGAVAAARAGGAPSQEATDRYYDRAVQAARHGKADEALELFERALPGRADTSDIFFNLVQVAEAARQWRKVILYAQGFLKLESRSADAAEIRAALDRARRTLEGRETALTTVSFEVDPPGTLLFLDGVPVAHSGRGDTVLLAPGRYNATASRDDFAAWNQRVDVGTDGRAQTVTGALTAIVYQGRLEIVTDPPEGVEVFRDDEHIGTTPLEPLSLQADKRYLFRFEKPGYDKWVRYITVGRDESQTLKPRMETLEQSLRMK
ncbi:MAG: PEGA domain-containing protein [Myxococcales bacterium]|nr:PEGA domain-containing protein [Myxococcales bacterium]